MKASGVPGCQQSVPGTSFMSFAYEKVATVTCWKKTLSLKSMKNIKDAKANDLQ